MTRPSPYIAVLHQYSVNRKTSLSLRPVDHKLLAPAFAYTCTGLITCNFTVRSEKMSCRNSDQKGSAIRLPIPDSSVIPEFLRFKARRIGWPPCRHPGCHTGTLSGLFSHRERLLLRPEGPYILMRTILRHATYVGGFRLPVSHHFPTADLSRQVSLSVRAEIPRASKHWHALFIELAIGMVQIWNCQVSFSGSTRYTPSFDGHSRNTKTPFRLLPLETTFAVPPASSSSH